MSFERLGDVLGSKDIDKTDDLMAFFEQARSVIKKHAHVDVESLTYKHDILGVTVGGNIEATEIRLRHIQIERDLTKRSRRVIRRVTVRVN